MTITNGYCTLDEAKLRLWPSGVSSSADTSDDVEIEGMVETASRQIDDDTGRHFYTTSADETRYYRPLNSTLVLPDDIVSIASGGLQTDGDYSGTFATTWATTWATTDYQLLPDNATALGLPYNKLARAPLGSYVFPAGYKSVKITGKFGFTSVPTKIKQACLLYMQILYNAKNAFGAQGRNNQTVDEMNKEYQKLIQTYVRIV
jgi:hypothetical protein